MRKYRRGGGFLRELFTLCSAISTLNLTFRNIPDDVVGLHHGRREERVGRGFSPKPPVRNQSGLREDAAVRCLKVPFSLLQLAGWCECVRCVCGSEG